MVNREKIHAVTLTLLGQCPMLNSSELFSYTTICFIYYKFQEWIEPLFFELSCTQTDTQADAQIDRHTQRQT